MGTSAIAQAVIAGNYLELYWALRRGAPHQAWEALVALDSQTLAAFIVKLVNDWYRAQAELAAANDELDVGSVLTP